MKLIKVIFSFLVFFGVLLAQPLYAARGITSDNAGPHHSGLHNQETIEDMRVKVLGGYLRMNRVWRGQHWEWNERWADIKPLYQREQVGNRQEDVLVIYRAGQVYRKSGHTKDTITYENQLNQFITKTTDKYIWSDRNGNGIEYDLDGRVTSYHDKNKVYVYLERDANKNITRIKDHHQNTVLTLDYESYPNPDTKAPNQTLYRVVKLKDYSNREVVYGWNNKHQLETVTDVRGQAWTYVYSGPLLVQLKDPDGRITRYDIKEDGKFISRFNADGVGEIYQYNYDKQNKIYYRSKTNGAGQVTETWSNGMGQPVKESANGEDKIKIEYFLSDGSAGVENLMKNYSYRVEYWYRGSTFLYKLAICGPGQTPEGDGCVVTDPGLVNNAIYVKNKKVKDANGNITIYEYDQWKNETGVTYPDGTRTIRKFHSQWSVPVSETNQKGVTTAYDYETHGNLMELVEAKGTPQEKTTRYIYDEYGQIKSKSIGESAANDTDIATTQYEYDQYGNVTQIIDPEGNITKYSDYDALGNAQTITDARANVLPVNERYSWKNTYDAAGNLLTRRDPYNKGETYTYTKTGDLETTTAASGSQVVLTSNANGLPLTMVDGNGKVTKLEYDKAGRLTFTTDANGNKTQTAYDAQGRTVRTVDGEGNTTQFNYAADQLRNIQYPTYKELMEYDNRNQIKQITQQANNRNYIQKLGYDLTGNISNNTDAQNNNTVYEYDLLNRIKKITDAEGGVTEFYYDARDNLLQVKDPEGRLTIYTYDKNNRLLSETKDGDQNTNKQRRYEYDHNGNLISSINPEQEKITYEFDQANRLVKTRVFANKDHAHPVKVISYNFNEKNHLVGWSQQAPTTLPDGVNLTADVIPLSETYSYNNLDQLESVTVNFGGFSKTYSYTYYPNGLKKTYTNPENITYTYYYNKNNQLMAVHIPGEGQISWANFQWLVPQTLLLPGGQKISLKYNDFQQLEENVLKKADNTELAKAVYEYDLAQNIKKIQKNEGAFNYNYDNLYRLTNADSPISYANDETFDYDGVGNRTSRTENGVTDSQSYNQKNQLLAIDSSDNNKDVTYTYNANGHTKTQTKSGVVTEYVYNHEERLIKVKKDGSTLGEYVYNPNGQRVKKTASGNITWYLYNEHGLAAEYNAAGQLIKEYHFHPQKTWMTDPLFQRNTAGELYYYHNDHLGTPQKMLDNAGNIVWAAKYSVFGKAHIALNTAENNLRFPGQYFDAETGLHHNFMRDYDPELGRYIEYDSIGLIAGINAYSYAYQNPKAAYDPDGKVAILIVDVVIVTLMVAAAIATALNKRPNNAAYPGADPTEFPSIPTDNVKPEEKCPPDSPCPPCKTTTGREVVVGTVGYRPLDVIPDDRKEHGVWGSHHNIFVANQAPRNSPQPCKCFWQKMNYVLKPEQLTPNMVPVEPFM